MARWIREFIKLEAAGGLILMAAAVAAMVVANVPLLQAGWSKVLNWPVTLNLGLFVLEKNVLLLINDGLMALFFLIVGLELKREVLEGELRDVRRILLPCLAAIGGVSGPAIIYATLNWGQPSLAGWAIPGATDIAFSLGILALLGSRVPLSLKIFLTTLAVVDDLIAILVIAIFYTAKLNTTALLVGGGFALLLIVLNRVGVRNLAVYIVLGLFLWLAVLKSGVHATLAGVVLGLIVPADTTNHKRSGLHKLEHGLHPWVAYLILPLFALANAGLTLQEMRFSDLAEPVTLGIAVGLPVGNLVGILSLVAFALWTGLARSIPGGSWVGLAGIALLAGVGFTMSLFIGLLAFPGEAALLSQVRLGVILGSLVSGTLGVIVLLQARFVPVGDDEPVLDVVSPAAHT